jgi:hypothetical protein
MSVYSLRLSERQSVAVTPSALRSTCICSFAIRRDTLGRCDLCRTVKRSRVGVKFDGHAGIEQRQGVEDAFITQRVELHRRHVCGWQTSEVSGTSGRRVFRHFCGIRCAEIVGPTQFCAGSIPFWRVDKRTHAVCREPVVEHWNGEELKAQRRTAAIATKESQAAARPPPADEP